MKKLVVAVVVAAVGLAFTVYAQEATQKTTVKGGTVTQTTEMKGPAGKVTETKVTTPEETTTTTSVKGKTTKVERAVTDTPTGETGMLKVETKKGAFDDFKIDWTYNKVGTEYVTEYTIKDKENKALMKELNLTPQQVAMIKPGTHRIVSTSPFTGEDIRTNIRGIILNDIRTAATKK